MEALLAGHDLAGTFMEAAAAERPAVATDVAPEDPLVTKPNPPPFGFTLTGDVERIRSLTCFMADGKRVRTERLDTRIETRFDKALPQGRTRLNCTLPGADGRWRWFGTSFYVPR